MFDHNTHPNLVFAEVNRLGVMHGHVVDACGHFEKAMAWHQDNGAWTLGAVIAATIEHRSDWMARGAATLVCRKYLSDLLTPELRLDYMRCCAVDAVASWMVRYCVRDLPEEIDDILPPLPDNVREGFDADPLWNTAPDDF